MCVPALLPLGEKCANEPRAQRWLLSSLYRLGDSSPEVLRSRETCRLYLSSKPVAAAFLPSQLQPLVSPSRSWDQDLSSETPLVGPSSLLMAQANKHTCRFIFLDRNSFKFQIQKQRKTSLYSAWSTGKRPRVDGLPRTWGFT